MVKNDENYIIINNNKKNTKFFYWVFLGILVFLVIYMPFFGMNLRYQTSSFLRMIFGTCGTWILTIGGFMVVFGFIGIFTRSSKWMEWLILGGVMLWIGSWLTGAPFAFFDIFFSGGAGDVTGGGYH